MIHKTSLVFSKYEGLLSIISDKHHIVRQYVNGLVQDCSNACTLSMESLQSYSKPLM